jgi:hypothetical protein
MAHKYTQNIIPSQNEGANAVFGCVIGKGTSSVKQVVLHKLFLVLCIGYCFAEGGALQYMDGIQPAPKGIQNRSFQFQTLGIFFIRCKSGQPFFDFKKPIAVIPADFCICWRSIFSPVPRDCLHELAAQVRPAAATDDILQPVISRVSVTV